MWGLTKRQECLRDRIYLDYAGATPVIPEATAELVRCMHFFGNPGALHAEGVIAMQSLISSRERIAHELGCKARQIIFVSGGTEANNLSILGFARALARDRSISAIADSGDLAAIDMPLSGTHWIVSSIEHPSVLECFAEIEGIGGSVDFVDPDVKGVIRPEAVGALLRRQTVFVSIGWGNGEIGTIQPLSRIRALINGHEKEHGSTVILHSDAGQALLYDAANVHSLGVDLLSIDSGKLYGPRGIGCVYLSERAKLSRIVHGGKQERGLRAGTENVALAAGFAAAFKTIAHERVSESKRIGNLRDELSQQLQTIIAGMIENGDSSHAMPHIINISIPDINSEYLVLALDHAGIALSTKSACREGEEQQSHVVEALAAAAQGQSATGQIETQQMNEWRSRNTLRFSLGRETTHEDIARTVQSLHACLKAARA